jgi:hypothetical protein
MSYEKIAFIKYYPIFYSHILDEENANLYFSIIDVKTDNIEQEFCVKISSDKGDHVNMLYNPILSILSGDPKNNHSDLDDKITLIYDIDMIILFDGLLDSDNNPYLLNMLQSKLSCPIISLCKSVLKHKDTYKKTMDFDEKKENNIFITKRHINMQLSTLEIASISDKYGREYMKVINANSNKKPLYRFIIPSNKSNNDTCINIIKKNIISGGGTIFESYANKFMKLKMKSDSISK